MEIAAAAPDHDIRRVRPTRGRGNPFTTRPLMRWQAVARRKSRSNTSGVTLIPTNPQHPFRHPRRRTARFSVLLLSCALLLPSAPAIPSNAVPFVDIVSPVSITPGSVGVTITVRGAGFVSSSVVHWNGTALSTTFVNAKELTATVPNSLVAAVGLGVITIVSP